MKKPWYAHGARKLLEVRQGGMAPEGSVLVNLSAEDLPGAIVVKADMPTDRLDWRMLVNLNVEIFAGQAAGLDWLLETTSRIAHSQPQSLFVRFDHEGLHDVEVGTGLHLPKVRDIPAQHSFSWVPINCSGTLTGARLRKALIAKHPRWTTL